MIIKMLRPGMLLFVGANGETAAPGWYRVLGFDHEQSRRFSEDGWWWTCQRLCDGMLQTISETEVYMLTEIEGEPTGKLLRCAGCGELLEDLAKICCS